MTHPLTSTDFDTVHAALESGAITPKNVADRFVDFKTLYDQSSNLEANDRCELATPSDTTCLDDSYLFATGRSEGNPLSLWLDYRCCPQTVDCDGCKSAPVVAKAANELYRALWPDVQKRGADSADTMNSFWTIYKRALVLDGKPVSGAGDIPAIRNNQKSCRLSVDAVRSQTELLAHLTHTCGNFIPVGGKFQQRGGPVTMDFWDITLQYVKEWYGGSTGVGFLTRCDKWLSSFGEGSEGWNCFVEQNFLQPYTTFENGIYEVRRFFAGHTFSHLLPENNEELLACLRSMNASIIARGNLMLEKTAKLEGSR